MSVGQSDTARREPGQEATKEQKTQASGDPRVGLARDRTDMAVLRTELALDRTTLAWIRTSLAMASFGFSMVSFFRSLRAQAPTAEAVRMHQGAIEFGTGLLVLGTLVTALAGFSHWSELRRLRTGQPLDSGKWPLSMVLALLLALLFMAGLWNLFAR
jgi:putative membrane protein